MYSKKYTFGLACIATICLSVLAAPTDNTDERSLMIKNAFKHAWQGYSAFAYGHDELQPITNGTTDSR